ncbi:MAG TPA: thiamine phosphate synthase, partial [Mycobacterium sp.]|nr:thiamine phosphate synthase [Mycobacterium sp.]
HLGQRDLPLAVARDIVGPDILIGRSTHDRDQVAAAVADDVDYFCVGPCWSTPTKPGRQAAGLDLVHVAAEVAGAKPWFAIGGIDGGRLPEVLAAGARRVVVVRAITTADDPRAAAERLSSALAAAS